MAQLNKYLHIKEAGVDTDTAIALYTTTDESGQGILVVKTDDIVAYPSTIGAIETKLKFKKDDTTYTVTENAVIPYGNTKYTTAGTYTFTVPAGVTKVRVSLIGGGGGAAVCSCDKPRATGGSGGNSSAVGLTGTGGAGGSAYFFTSGSYWDFEQLMDTFAASAWGGAGGSPDGVAGSQSGSSYGDGTSIYGAGGVTINNATYGGGSGAKAAFSAYIASGGSGGRYLNKIVSVEPNSTYSIVVGGLGGNSSQVTSNALKYWNNGQAGCVFIEYGGDIK